MKAQTGIVMKIEKNTAVVMKNGGEFVSLPANRSWKTGEVILLPEKRRSLGGGLSGPGIYAGRRQLPLLLCPDLSGEYRCQSLH